MNAISGIFPARAGSIYIDPFAKDAIKDPNIVPLISSEAGRTTFPNVGIRHGRNHFDANNEVFNANFPLIDGFGNYFLVPTVKGIDASNPFLSRDTLEPNDVRVNGLQDAEIFLRCWAASRYLRKRNILTEWMMYAAIPETFPDAVNDEANSVDQLQFKEFIYNEFLEPNKSTSYVGAAAMDLLDEFDFGVSYRSVLSPYRLFDAPHFVGDGLFEAIGQSIDALQRRKPHNYKAWQTIRGLNPQNQREQIQYYRYYLPAIIGENLAKTHNSGVALLYPHGGNWTLAGEIVDLDSAKGRGIFLDTKLPLDCAINQSDKLRDFLITMSAVEEYIDFSDGQSVAMFMNGYVTSRKRIEEPERVILNSLPAYVNYLFGIEDPSIATLKRDANADSSEAFIAEHFPDLSKPLSIRLAGILAVSLCTN